MLASIIVLGACQDTVPTAATAGDDVSPPELRLPRLSLAGCTGGPCNEPPDEPWVWTTTIGTGNADAVDSSPSTFSFPQRTRIRITVEGTIGRRYIDGIGGAHDSMSGREFKPVDANGEWLASAKGAFIYTDLTGVGQLNAQAIGPSPNSHESPTVASYTTGSFVVRGTGPLRRFAFLQPPWPGPSQCTSTRKCVIATGGTQDVTVEVTSLTLTLTAVPDSITAGDLVTFTASSPLAVQVQEWVWVPTAGSGHTTDSLCTAQLVSCTLPVFESGTMYALARVGNGTSAVLEKADAGVVAMTPVYDVVSCPTGDSLLDLPATRALLREIWARTDSIVPKREWGGYVYRLPDGSYRAHVDTISVSSDPCRAASVDTAAPHGWEHVLLAHSHPSRPNKPICDPALNLVAKSGPHKGLHSYADWDRADPRWHGPPTVPVAVIDPKVIAVAGTGEWIERKTMRDAVTGSQSVSRYPSRAQFDSAYFEADRQGASCARP